MSSACKLLIRRSLYKKKNKEMISTLFSILIFSLSVQSKPHACQIFHHVTAKLNFKSHLPYFTQLKHNSNNKMFNNAVFIHIWILFSLNKIYCLFLSFCLLFVVCYNLPCCFDTEKYKIVNIKIKSGNCLKIIHRVSQTSEILIPACLFECFCIF